MIWQFIAATVSTACFSIMFNGPKKEILFCGLTGGIGWVIYKIFINYGYGIATGTFFSAIVITILSRILANYRKTPITIFLISGIIPLVPGAPIYYTLYNIILSNNYTAALKGLETLKTAGAIAVAVIIILSLPRYFFTFGNKNYFDKKKGSGSNIS